MAVVPKTGVTVDRGWDGSEVEGVVDSPAGWREYVVAIVAGGEVVGIAGWTAWIGGATEEVVGGDFCSRLGGCESEGQDADEED